MLFQMSKKKSWGKIFSFIHGERLTAAMYISEILTPLIEYLKQTGKLKTTIYMPGSVEHATSKTHVFHAPNLWSFFYDNPKPCRGNLRAGTRYGQQLFCT